LPAPPVSFKPPVGPETLQVTKCGAATMRATAADRCSPRTPKNLHISNQLWVDAIRFNLKIIDSLQIQLEASGIAKETPKSQGCVRDYSTFPMYDFVDTTRGYAQTLDAADLLRSSLISSPTQIPSLPDNSWTQAPGLLQKRKHIPKPRPHECQPAPREKIQAPFQIEAAHCPLLHQNPPPNSTQRY